jgi:hypothetical protein
MAHTFLAPGAETEFRLPAAPYDGRLVIGFEGDGLLLLVLSLEVGGVDRIVGGPTPVSELLTDDLTSVGAGNLVRVRLRNRGTAASLVGAWLAPYVASTPDGPAPG